MPYRATHPKETPKTQPITCPVDHLLSFRAGATSCQQGRTACYQDSCNIPPFQTMTIVRIPEVIAK